jgi:bifunctional non-homologous end joining protein LigD
MALEKYFEKRRFNKTPEPTGGKATSEKLLFVIQKHAASHLHYDFRLELRGVLKSWAVPKGPSMNPDDHRLAMAVEDHPFDYKDFEGIIPQGQYGGGTVIIWDQGTYEPAEKIRGKEQQEHWLNSHYYKSAINIILHGKKLKGEFSIVRNREKGDNAWLLTKVADKYALKTDITKKDKSVVSGLTIEQMAEKADANVWNSNRAEKPKKQSVAKDHKTAIIAAKDFPDSVQPMLATLIKKPFNDPDWIFEVKFDGFRCIASKNGDVIRLRSREEDLTKDFPEAVEAVKGLNHNLILDGELVSVDENGHPNFNDVQKKKNRKLPLRYYVFDLLWLDCKDLRKQSVVERREILKTILPEDTIITFSRDFPEGIPLFDVAKQHHLEGIVAKRKESSYQSKRSKDWLKLPAKKVQDFVVGAYTESGSGNAFRSLIFGNYVNGVFTYVGHCGHGFSDTERHKVLAKLKKLETNKSPFSTKVQTETKAHWLKPELVITVEFATWTEAGNIRKPATFKGFRTDKDPKECVPEIPLDEKQNKQVIAKAAEISDAAKDAPPLKKTTSKLKATNISDFESQFKPVAKRAGTPPYLNEDSNWPKLDQEEITSEREVTIEGSKIRLTNVEKQLWDDVTKADLIMYYSSISEYILPHLKDRPLSLHIKNLSPAAPGIYIKDMEGRQPDYAIIHSTPRKHKKKGKRDIIDYLVCNNLATLVYLINLGCIDINPWMARTSSPLNPDFVNIDLDPSDDDFSKAIKAAEATKEVLNKYKLKGYPKTSGKTGIHIYIPCRGFTFPQARKISESLGREIQALLPDITTTEVSISKRGTKLFIDPSQNDEADTLACAYSVRPYHIATVSTPLDWKEINDKLNPAEFTIHSIKTRLEKKGDLFSPVLNDKIALKNSEIISNVFLKTI